MKTQLLLATAFLIVASSGSEAQDTYVSGQIGVRAVEQFDASIPGASAQGELGNGVYVAGAFGRQHGNWRYEAELAHRGGQLNAFSVGGAATGASGDGLTATSLMANAYYDFGDRDGFTPFIGAGLGVARVEADFSGAGGRIDGQASAFAYQLIGGASWSVSQTTSVFVDARYFRTADTDYTLTAPLGVSDITFEYDGYTLGGGLRFAF